LSAKINLPSIEEQRRIASVLSAADREIVLLKQELTNLTDQKKGLMQKLLTGEVRVKN
jgi:type I restriction enzyme S subunit